MEHKLKILSKYYEAILQGKKTFEVRKDDRPFNEGDTLLLQEAATSEGCGYTGREMKVDVTYILRDNNYVNDGYCIMGIKIASAKRELIIIEADLYNDGDWGTECKLFEGYVSKYFDTGFYEYTSVVDYYIKFRRVFKSREAAIQFVTTFSESIHGREYEVNKMKSICEHMIIALKYEEDYYSGEISGNSEGTLTMHSECTKVLPIKEIIYEEQ